MKPNPALALPRIRSTNDTLFCATYCTDLTGTFEKSGPSPSAIVGWTRTASRSLEYGKLASIAVCTAAKTSPASEPIIVKPRMRSSLPKDLHEALCFVRCLRPQHSAHRQPRDTHGDTLL